MASPLALVCGFATIVASTSVRAGPDETKTSEPTETEINGLPLIGGDTDNGFGGGAMGSIAGVDAAVLRHRSPYNWRLEFAAFYATKGGVFEPSYEDVYALFTLPHLLNDRLRLEVRPSFTKDSSLRYFGLGNYAPDPAMIDPTRDYYSRIHPSLSVDTTWRLAHPFYGVVGVQYTYNRLAFDPSSTLAAAMQSPDPYIRNTTLLDTDHSVMRYKVALLYDTRDNEISTHRGQYHQLEFRASPGFGGGMPYTYSQIDVQTRYYYSPIPRYLTLAARGVFDVLLGDVPFYELSRYEDTSAIGGSLGVRGVPAYRYYGRVKAFVNLEARSETFHMTMYGKPIILGFAAFFDAGRLWSEIDQQHPELDGTGLGLHYGIGGGLRLQEGRTYVVRADVAWSPDARPIAIYLIGGHIF